MKRKNMFVLAVSVLMTAACSTGISDSSQSLSENNPSTPSSIQQPSSIGSTGTSTKPSSSSSPNSSTTQWNPLPDVNKPEVNKLPDYHIFDKVPSIKFTNDGTDVADATNFYATNKTSWATVPSKGGASSWYAKGKLSVTDCDEKFALSDVDVSMKVRGNYTTTYDKKAFRIKFNKKQSMLGLNNNEKFKNWVLLADTKDTSLLRNSLGFYLGQGLMDEDLFCSEFTPVHVYLEDNYWGMYTLAEQKEVKTNRVNVAEPPADDYAGTDIGYLIELDHYYAEEAAKGLDGDPTVKIQYKPSPISYYAQGQQFGDKQLGYIESGYTIGSDITNRETQLPFLKNRLENHYTILYNAAFNNKLQEISADEKIVDSTSTDPEMVLAKSIDIDSFVSAYILAELSCDPDVGYSSFYLSLDMSSEGNKLLTCNCPWDFDTTFGIRQGTVENSQGFYALNSTNMWLSMIAKMPFFQAKVRDKWNAVKEAGLFTNASKMINEYTTKYATDYNKNFTRWSNHFGYNMTAHEVRQDVQRLRTQKDNSNQMKAWFEARVKWLDDAFNGKLK